MNYQKLNDNQQMHRSVLGWMRAVSAVGCLSLINGPVWFPVFPSRYVGGSASLAECEPWLAALAVGAGSIGLMLARTRLRPLNVVPAAVVCAGITLRFAVMAAVPFHDPTMWGVSGLIVSALLVLIAEIALSWFSRCRCRDDDASPRLAPV